MGLETTKGLPIYKLSENEYALPKRYNGVILEGGYEDNENYIVKRFPSDEVYFLNGKFIAYSNFYDLVLEDTDKKVFIYNSNYIDNTRNTFFLADGFAYIKDKKNISKGCYWVDRLDTKEFEYVYDFFAIGNLIVVYENGRVLNKL